MVDVTGSSSASASVFVVTLRLTNEEAPTQRTVFACTKDIDKVWCRGGERRGCGVMLFVEKEILVLAIVRRTMRRT